MPLFKQLILWCSNELTELNLNKKNMKTLLRIASVAMLFVQTSMAQELSEVQNPNVIETPSYFAKFNSQENAFKMRVLLTKRDGDKSILYLNILDKNGNKIYSKYLDKKESQARVDLNLEELPDGIYTFELSNKYGQKQKTYVKETEKQYINYTKQLIALN